jgi:selenoprotein W-related protein
LREKLTAAYPGKIDGFELVPSKGGCFELTVNGELVYSKLQTGVFPDEDELVDDLEKFTKAVA